MDGNGAGRVFLLYTNVADAQRAYAELGKRKFGDSFIAARLYPDTAYLSGRYNL